MNPQNIARLSGLNGAGIPVCNIHREHSGFLLQRVIKMTPMSQEHVIPPPPHPSPETPHRPHPIGPIAWLLPLLWLLLDAAWELSGALPAPEIAPRPVPLLVWKGLGLAAAAALLLHFGVHAVRVLRSWLRTQNAFLTHPYPMCWIDPATHQIVQANTAASALLGASIQQLRGQPTSRFWEHADTPQTAGALPAEASVRVRRGDGQQVTMELGVLRGNANTGPGTCLVILREHTGDLRAQVASRHRELKALTRRLLSVQEDERRTLSHELHDEIGQAITAIKLSACSALEETDADRRHEDLSAIITTAEHTIATLRNIATLLRPPQLDALGLEAALRGHVTTLLRTLPDGLTLELDIQPLPQRPIPDSEQVCFRIAQESLTNALRHAAARQIRVHLGDHDQQHLYLRIEDDGVGFDPATVSGLGLVIMRERAQSAGGRLDIDTAPGYGTCIRVLLPYAQPD